MFTLFIYHTFAQHVRCKQPVVVLVNAGQFIFSLLLKYGAKSNRWTLEGLDYSNQHFRVI